MSRWSLWTRHIRRDALNAAVNLPLLPRPARLKILRAAGVDVRDAAIEGRLWISSANVTIGDGTYMNVDVHLDANGGITIGRFVRIGPRVTILTSDHQIGISERRCGAYIARPVEIGDGSWIGSGVTVLPGVSIAPGCVIAANSVVTRDTESDGLYAGVPARRIRDLDRHRI